MHVYITSKPGKPVMRRCAILLSPNQTCFNIQHTPQLPMEHTMHATIYRRIVLLRHIATTSFQVLMSGRVNQSLENSFAAPEPATLSLRILHSTQLDEIYTISSTVRQEIHTVNSTVRQEIHSVSSTVRQEIYIVSSTVRQEIHIVSSISKYRKYSKPEKTRTV